MSVYPPTQRVGACPYCEGRLMFDGVTGSLKCSNCNRRWSK